MQHLCMSSIKLLTASLIMGLMMGVASASEFGYKLEKAVNSGWQHSYIVNHTIGGSYQAYLNTEAVFLAPRSDPFRANHEYFGVDIGAKVKVWGWDVSGGTGSRWMWEGNSQGFPAGYSDWNNYISIMKEI